jgi:hypothetical protein
MRNALAIVRCRMRCRASRRQCAHQSIRQCAEPAGARRRPDRERTALRGPGSLPHTFRYLPPGLPEGPPHWPRTRYSDVIAQLVRGSPASVCLCCPFGPPRRKHWKSAARNTAGWRLPASAPATWASSVGEGTSRPVQFPFPREPSDFALRACTGRARVPRGRKR